MEPAAGEKLLDTPGHDPPQRSRAGLEALLVGPDIKLWVEPDEEQTFCLAGPMGEDARSLLTPGARKVWTVEAESHFDAMTKYYEYMGWGEYTSEHAWDRELYPDDWL